MKKFLLSLMGLLLCGMTVSAGSPQISNPTGGNLSKSIVQAGNLRQSRSLRGDIQQAPLQKTGSSISMEKRKSKGIMKVSSTESYAATMVCNQLGLSNSEQVAGEYWGNDIIHIGFETGSGSNIPAYYNIGEAIRIYNGNQVVVESNYSNVYVTDIEFTLENSNKWTVAPTVSGGAYSLSTQSWSGYENIVTLTTSQKVYIQKVVIYYTMVSEDDTVSEYYFLGSFNDWDVTNSANKMVEQGSGFVKRNVEFSGANTSGEFKIAAPNWTDSWGYGINSSISTITSNTLSARLTRESYAYCTNMFYELEGIYDVFWNPNNEVITFEKVGNVNPGGGDNNNDKPALSIFTYVPSEWNYIGESEFKDAWYEVFWSSGVAPRYSVPTYINIANPNLYLLMNPYGPDTPYADTNASSQTGYIVIDVTNPDCVLVRPGVYSISLYFDYETTPSPFYNTNTEGTAYYEGMSYSEIISTLQNNGGKASSYNAAEGLISIRNATFALSPSTPLETYLWNGGAMEGYVYLPGYGDVNNNTSSSITIKYSANGQELEKEIQPSANGTFEIELANLDWFWFIENSTNAAFSVNLYESTLGMNLPSVNFLETNKPYTYTPWTGTYKIVVASNLSPVTVTTNTPKPSTIDIYLPGDYNDWTFTNSNKFTQTSGGNFTFTVPADITSGWKIGTPVWRYDYGYAGAVNPSDVYQFDYNTVNNTSIPLYKGDVVNLTINPDLYYKPATVTIVRANLNNEEPPVVGEAETMDIDGVIYTIYPDAGYFMATDGSNAKGEVSLISSTKGFSLRGVAASAFANNIAITSITIPEGATTVSNEAFRECMNLQEVNLPSTLTNIGRYAFLGCSYINRFSLPAKVNSIGIGAFQGCTDLEVFKFNQANLTELPDALFEGCERLQEVDIPMSVSKIGSNAFFGAGVVKIGTTVNVSSIGDRAFEDSNLAQFDFNNVANIGIGAFKGTKIKSAEMTSALTSLGEQAFANCANLSKVELSSKITSIGKSTFEGCESLTSIDIPESVTAIWANAFYNSGLVNVSVGDNVTELGANAFVTTSLTSISLGSGIANLDNTPLYTEGLLRLNSTTPPTLGTDRLGCTPSVVIVPKGTASKYLANSRWKSYNIVEEGNDLIIYLSAPGSLISDIRMKQTVPNQVTSLVIVTNTQKGTLNDADWASLRSTMISLIKLDISDADVKSIPDNCFKGKKILTEIALPKSLQTIGEHAFENCTLLGGINLPSSLVSIKESAFEGCNSMAGNLVIPANCTEVGASAFKDCYALENLRINSSSLKAIAESTFENCRSLEEVVLPEGLNTIGEKAFAEAGIFTVNIPSSLTKIEDSAFEGCFYLSSVNLPSVLTEVGSRAFAKSGLIGVTLPASIKSIEDETFDSCDDLRFVNLPSSLTTIGDRALASPSISAISSPAQTPPVGGYEPFEGINYFTCTLSIPAFSFNDYITAPYWGAFGEIHDNIDVNIDGNPNVTYTDEEDYQALTRSNLSRGIKGRKVRNANAAPAVNPSDFAQLFNGAQMFIPEGTQTRFFFLGVLSNYRVEYNGKDVTAEIDKATKSWLSPAMSGSSRLKITNTDTGVDDIIFNSTYSTGNVYDLTGRLVIANASQSDIEALSPGFYIIAGKKVVVK